MLALNPHAGESGIELRGGPVHPRDTPSSSPIQSEKTPLNEVCITFLFGHSEGFGFRPKSLFAPPGGRSRFVERLLGWFTSGRLDNQGIAKTITFVVELNPRFSRLDAARLGAPTAA